MNIELYNSIATKVAKLYARRLGQQHLLEDLTQEAWLGMLTSKPERGKDIKKYLWGSACNAVKSFIYRFKLSVRTHAKAKCATLRQVPLATLHNISVSYDRDALLQKTLQTAIRTLLDDPRIAHVIAQDAAVRDMDITYVDVRRGKRRMQNCLKLKKAMGELCA